MIIKRGFTLIELLVVLAVIATLLSLVAPHYIGSVGKAKETVLKENLATLRSTIDKYYADTGQYPESLDELVGRRYLRTVPEDPITESKASWVLIPPPEKFKGTVYDVKSAAPGLGRDGQAYKDW